MVSDGSRAGTRITDSERSSLRTALDLLRGSQQCGRSSGHAEQASLFGFSCSRRHGELRAGRLGGTNGSMSRLETGSMRSLRAMPVANYPKTSRCSCATLSALAQLQQASEPKYVATCRVEECAHCRADRCAGEARPAPRGRDQSESDGAADDAGRDLREHHRSRLSAPQRAATFHLQWREQGETQWTSSKASEQIKVPCCTKGQLKLSKLYEFRVRAADPDGRWGPWSEPTVAIAPVPPSRHLPSRPKMRALSKGCLQARWQAPTDGETQIVQYELQWRQSQMDWGEADASLQTSDAVASTTPLQVGVHYLFRVRAMVEHPKRGKIWTPFGPPSVPIQPVASKTSAKAKEGSRTDADIPSLPDIPIPVRNSTADDGETVIAAQIREVAQMSTNPDVQPSQGEAFEEMVTRRKRMLPTRP